MTHADFSTVLNALKSNRVMSFLAGFAVVFVLMAGGWWLTSSRTVQAEDITMYKNIGCQCCTRWAERLKAKGHTVLEKPVSDLDAIKKQFGIHEKFQGCHTALIGGYVIEGHVPMQEIDRLLRERPDAKGLSVPGMPMGSEGMEVPGERPDPYTVFLMKKDGTSEVWAKY